MVIYFNEREQKESSVNFKNLSICGKCMNSEFAYYICAGICRIKKYIFNSDYNCHGKTYNGHTYINILRCPILECDCFNVKD